ncbi:hypothetical protein JCM10213_001035 [Rhodosporidiobolus nylandii]
MSSQQQQYPYGLAPVSRDPSALSPANAASAPLLTSADLLALIPDSEVCRRSADFVKVKLGEQLSMHSMRAFSFGAAIATTQFPEWEYSPEALYLACLFHDLGATEAEMKSTKTSFEFHSAVLVCEYLTTLVLANGKKVERDLVDSVCEAIWRHTDFISSQITVTGQLLQLGTLYDNLHDHADWIHPHTAAEVVRLFPRTDWAGCFHDTMKKEVELKPWSHTTAFGYIGEPGRTPWDRILEDSLGKAVKQEAEKNAGE